MKSRNDAIVRETEGEMQFVVEGEHGDFIILWNEHRLVATDLWSVENYDRPEVCRHQE